MVKKLVFFCGGVAVVGVLALYFPSHENQLEQYFQNGEYKESLEIVRERLRADQHDLLALEYKARIYLKYSLQHAGYLGQLESEYLKKAIETLQILININNAQQQLGHNYYKVCFLMGFTHFLQGDYGVALKYLDLSIHLVDRIDDLLEFIDASHLDLFVEGQRYSFSPYALLGYVAYKAGDSQKAIESFLKVSHDSDETIHRFYLALLYKNTGLIDEAISEYRKVILKEESEFIRFRACLHISDLFIQKRDYAQAKKYLYQAELMQASAEVLYRLGVVYESEGKLSSAITKWKKALNLNPKHNLSRLKLTRFAFKHTKKS